MADLRSTVYGKLSGDVTLHALGLAADAVYLNNSADSPTADRFMVLRWGSDVPLMGAQRSPKERSLELWVYDRGYSYEYVCAILSRGDAALKELVGASTGSGYIVDIRWAGDSDDGWDDVYERVFKSATYTIVGTGD